ncbi:MAG: hypothetical protein LBU90_03705 [Bacteroidales bacterium]|jgi:hypothetical protein|nr:hypothetical protein [Bacteroidales bacterium]
MLKNLDPRLQKIILVTIVVIVAYVGYTFLKPKIQEWFLSKNRESERKSEINKNDLSYSDVEYRDMAATIFNAMDGIGTNVEAIYNVARKMKTKSDWLRLVDVFGIKEVNSGLFFVGNYKGNLPELLPTELSSGEMQELNFILKSINVSL